MIINTTQVEMVLNNKAIPAYSLEAENRKKKIYTQTLNPNRVFLCPQKGNKKSPADAGLKIYLNVPQALPERLPFLVSPVGIHLRIPVLAETHEIQTKPLTSIRTRSYLTDSPL